jgi:uncharacterized membrane protein
LFEWIIGIVLGIGILFVLGIIGTYFQGRAKEQRELMDALRDIQTTLELIKRDLDELKNQR